MRLQRNLGSDPESGSNNFPIHDRIYIKFDQEMRNSVINMPTKILVKIINISRVIQNLIFSHVISKIRKFSALGRTRSHNMTIFFV